MSEGDQQASTLIAARDAVVAEHGAWMGANVHLGHGVYTMGHDYIGAIHFLVDAVVQAVADLAGKPVAELRVLDLACGEGLYSIEFGLRGASVVGVEGRLANVAKSRFVADTLGLSNVTFVERDVRELTPESDGRFDVVLCLGILYHLPAADAVRLVRRCHDLADRLAVFRTVVGLRPDFAGVFAGHPYAGRRYREDTRERYASLDNPVSILPSRSSLLNLLADVGFTSAFELRNPPVPGLDAFTDNVTCIAMCGQRGEFKAMPQASDALSGMRRSEPHRLAWLRAVAIPQQGRYWRLRERLTGAVRKSIWQSHRPVDEWVGKTESPSRRARAQ